MLRPVLVSLACSLIAACASPPGPDRDLALQPRALHERKVAVTTNLGATPLPDEAPMAQGAGVLPPRAVPAGIGFTAGPSMFLLGGSADFPVDEHLTAGPALQIGFDDDSLLVAPHAQLRYWFLDDAERPVLKPFVQGGVGVVYLDPDRGDSDWGGLLNFGGGVRVLTGESYRLGSSILFNFVPGDVANETFYFSWEVLQLVVEF